MTWCVVKLFPPKTAAQEKAAGGRVGGVGWARRGSGHGRRTGRIGNMGASEDMATGRAGVPAARFWLDRRERQDVLEGRVVEAVRVRHGFVRDLAVQTFMPRASAGSDATASREPLSAIASTYGSVAFVSAFVDVTGTAPGMFATQ